MRVAECGTNIEIFPTAEYAESVGALLVARLKTGGSLVLSGGATPGIVYEALSRAPLVSSIPWERVRIYWGDERWVPSDDSRSNFLFSKERLLARLPVSPEHIYPIETTTHSSPEESAFHYNEIIARELDTYKEFTVVLLGIGDDGHTASLFPHSPFVEERTKLVISCPHPTDGTTRVSLTRRALFSAQQIYFLATTQKKTAIVASVIEGNGPALEYPARIYRDASERTLWCLDDKAAASLKLKIRSQP